MLQHLAMSKDPKHWLTGSKPEAGFGVTSLDLVLAMSHES